MLSADKKAFPCPSNATPQGMSYRQFLIAQIAPAALKAFYEHDAWHDCEDMAKSLMNAVDAILKEESK
ncbi:hypothetical protein [Pantoea stewartii]|uniref:hypothetical protein n=1 Tax=Pantoea stewartii TaxID=66269 RepID=UPI001628EBC7|nr:hypothetical protein [Pantoea stewartii]MBC0853864.1 hypothetical protein [Pantoea stewartii]